MELSHICSPQDLKRCTPDEVAQLIPQIRELIMRTVSENGGHLASNLGAVELTVALHRVFESPKDKILFDVGHQCYTHKILTGRACRMDTLRRYGGLSGFPRCDESQCDSYGTGHASTALSAALGLARSRDLQGGDEHIVAVVGDGAFTGGMCYEALNDAGSRKTRLIAILNDNQMSIAPNVGALNNYLTYLRTSSRWLAAKRRVEDALSHMPHAGRRLHHILGGMKNMLRTLFVRDNFFQALGFRYLGPVDGHDERALENFLRRARNFDEPVLLHVVTTKGRGYHVAEHEPGRTHGMPPFHLQDGLPRIKNVARSYGPAAGRLLTQLAAADARIVCVTAAMTESTGLGMFEKAYPQRLFDVGIAEEHAVTLAAGMARGGLRPFVAIYDTFMQRGYDQLVVDVCAQNLPVCFLMDRASIGGEDGPTHHGVFGLAFMRHIPNLQVLAPRCTQELEAMIRYALGHTAPVAIRYPRAEAVVQALYPYGGFAAGQWEVLEEGGDITILAASTMVAEALEVRKRLQAAGVAAAVVNASSIKPLDAAALARLDAAKKPYVTMEEHVLAGGFGSAVTEYCLSHGLTPPQRLFALGDQFIMHGSRDTLLKAEHLDAASIAETLIKIAEKTA